MEAAGILSTALGLGFLLHASQVAFFAAINGYIKSLFLHRRRLVLLLFLLCVFIYSVFQFITLLLLGDTSCSITVRFTLFFDQAARVSALALVAWKVYDETNNIAEKVFWVVVVGLRILIGGIVVGFTRGTFMPVCFPQPMHLLVGIVHIIFDAVCWGILLFRVVAIWMLFVDQGRRGKVDAKSQGYGLFLVVLGFIGWTIGSFPYLMNIGESIFFRMIPYILTLALALGILGCFPSTMLSIPTPRSDDPYNCKPNRFGPSVSSPARRTHYASPPNINPGDIESNQVNGTPAYGMGLDNSYNGARTSMMFHSIIGAPIVCPGAALPWSVDTNVTGNITRPKPAKAMPENRRPSISPSHNAGSSISGPMGPILRNGSFSTVKRNGEALTSNPLERMKTMDLKTAAEMERQHIDAAFEREQERKNFQEAASGVATPIISYTTPKSTVDYRSQERSMSVKRKPVIPRLSSGPTTFRISAVKMEESQPDSPSSLQQSVFAAMEGGSDWGMRYSTNSNETEDDDTTRYTIVSHAPYNPAAPPRIPQLELVEDDPKIMFVNEIVYDDLALVESIMGMTDVALTTARYSQPIAGTVRRSPSTTKQLSGVRRSPSTTKQLSGISTPTRGLYESMTSLSPIQIMDRSKTVRKLEERGTSLLNMDYELAAERSNPSRIDKKPLPEIPAPKVITGKKPPREMVFPIPPIRAPIVRKPVPPPITITIPTIFSPEIEQKAPTPGPVKTPDSVPSAKQVTPEKSERRLMSPDASYQKISVTAYEAANAWVDSISAISDQGRYAESIIEPLLPIAYDSANNISARSSTVISEYTHSALQHRSALTTSPLAEGDDESTDTEIGPGSECEDEDLEAPNTRSGSDGQTQSEADEIIMSGGEGYSTEESFEEYLSDFEEGYPDYGVVISDIEHRATYDKTALAERKLNAKLQGLTETLPHVIPHKFQIGDRIPTFSESRRKYGNKRRPPPSPIGFLMQQRRISQQQIQSRLTMFAGTQHLTPLEDLMNRLLVSHDRGKGGGIYGGRNSLIARLELEMGQQESKWVEMKKAMARSSIRSVEEVPGQILTRPSENLSQRRSLIAKVNSGVGRRLSAANKKSLSSTVQPNMWQLQLEDSQIEYLVQGPMTLKNPHETPVKPAFILGSQNTPVSVESGSDLWIYEEESPFGTIHGEAQRGFFYKDDNSNFSMNEDEGEDPEDYYEEEQLYEHNGGIQTLKATAYCPSTPSTNINTHLHTPLQVFYSSTTGSCSHNVKSSPISLLWNAHTTREQSTSPCNQLWAYHPHLLQSPLASPPAADIRFKYRITPTPVNKATTSLWTKALSPQHTSHTGLWRDSKDLRHKQIIAAPFTPGRSRRSLKRVTLLEEEVTVEQSGFFGKFRELWGTQKNSQPVDIPAVPAITNHLQDMEEPTNLTLDDVAIKYATKRLPPLEAFVRPQEPKNATHCSLWSHSSLILVVGPKTVLWNPTPEQNAPDTELFANIPSLRKVVPRQVVLSTLTSSTLWGTSQQPMVASLWSNTNNRYLWPQAAGAASIPSYLWTSVSPLLAQNYPPLSVRNSRTPLGSPVLDSTELWRPLLAKATKKTTSGLWSDGRTAPQEPASHAINYLWPTTPSLSFPYTPTPPRSRQANAPLATLMSLSLWKSSDMRTAKETSWTPPTTRRNSTLWPEGERERAEVGSLWPSGPPAKKIEVETVRSQSQTSESDLSTPASSMPIVQARFSLSTPPPLKSRQLWSPVVQKVGLWPHGGVEKVVSCTGHWTSATPLATTTAKTLLIRPRFALVGLSRSESKQLWTPVDVRFAEPESGKIWGDITAHQALTMPIIAEHVEETLPVLLWAAPKQVPHAITPRYLWPSAPALPLSLAAPATRARIHIIKSLVSLSSKTLWSSAPAQDPHLWPIPVIESGLWPHGKLKDTIMGAFWPSANPLSSKVNRSARVARPIAATLQLESSQLWGANTAPKVQLWTAPTKSTGLWPQGEVLGGVCGRLWPSAPGLVTVPIYSRQRSAVTLTNLESHELWNNFNTKPSLWVHSIGQSGLWPQGNFTTRKKQLWSSDGTLEMTVEERERKYVGKVTMAMVASGSLWSRPEEIRPKFTRWLEVTDKLPLLPINVPGLQTKDDVASLPRLKSSCIPAVNLSPIVAPRAKFIICREVMTHPNKSGRASNSRAAGTSSLLPGGSSRQGLRARTWAKQVGLWNADCSQKKRDKKSKDCGAHLPLNFCSPKQERNTARRLLAALESDHLWSSNRLWHSITKPARQLMDTPSPRERTLVAPRTCSLWQKCDKPIILAVIPVIPSRSNKLASSIPPPLFLAVGGPMWMSNKLSPRGPQRQMEILATATETNSKPWVFSAVKRKTVFEDLSIESTRQSTIARKPSTIMISMEGSLWEGSILTPAKPKLWDKENSQGLWMVDGNVNSSSSTTSSETMIPAVSTIHLWGKGNTATASIFANLPLESSRSRREFTTKTFLTPPEGLWRKKEVIKPLVVERSYIGLWGTTKSTTENTQITDDGIPTKAALTLWQKGNSGTSMFADLPHESSRSKKEHSTVTLPVFSEGMWKRKVALPERPQLWKPTPKETGLWDASAKTKTLAQISMERKAKGTQKPLWSKDSASRTTTKVPQRPPPANVRISDDLTLPKVTGGLWKPKTAAHQLPQQWTAPKPTENPTRPTGSLLWAQCHGSKTTTTVRERTVAFIPSNTPLPKLSGSLWKPKPAAKPTGLWNCPIKTVVTVTVPPSAPLWVALTASRTTTATPQRLPSSPKKKDSRSIVLPPVTGPLWQPPCRNPVKGLWKASAPPPHRPRRTSLLWEAHSASRTTTATPIRTTVPKRLTETPLQIVSGTLWKRPSSGPQKGLWKRTIQTVATFRKTSVSTLWSRESASRTTSAKPESVPFAPKPVTEKSLILPPATGELWAPLTTPPQIITLWSRPDSPPNGIGVWDAHGRTPSLAEIKVALASQQGKTALWQRRSILTSNAAITDTSKTPPSVSRKKLNVSDSTSTLPVTDNSLWRPCVDGSDGKGIMWVTKSSRSSSLESEFISPGVSHASTISDMSDESDSPPTTGEGDEFEPEVVRVHSTKVSVSSAIGESLWCPNGPGEKGKERGLWSGDGATENRRRVTERPVTIVLPHQREELPMWDGSHWNKPSAAEKTLWANQNSYACSSVSDEEFASAVSEFSEESHYEDFEPSSSELNHSSSIPSSSSHALVGQFRRDNYLLHQQPNTKLPENSPFVSSLRINNLRGKLRPTTDIPGGERKRRNTEGEEEIERLGVDSRPMERAVSMGEE